VGEEKGLAVGLGQPADELPAHQRMQLRILVDRPVDDAQQPMPLQRLDMLMQVGIIARRIAHLTPQQQPSRKKIRAAVSPRIALRSCSLSGASSTTLVGSSSPIGKGWSEPSTTLSAPATSQRKRRARGSNSTVSK